MESGHLNGHRVGTSQYALRGRDIDEPLKYRKRAIVLLLLYIPLVVIPWALTLVLGNRPLQNSSYYYQEGFLSKDVSRMRNWATAVNVLNSIASLITIPIISALLAQAAVVFTQRRSESQSLSIKHLFVLADRGWADVPTLLGSLRWREPGAKACKLFLWLAATLIMTSVIQQPLYQILVPMETISIPTCLDTNFLGFQHRRCDNARNEEAYRTIGGDIEPYQMAIVTHNDIMPNLVSGLASISDQDLQPNLWSDSTSAEFALSAKENPEIIRSLQYNIEGLPYVIKEKEHLGRPYFVAALETNTTTGVLREHIMRMNSSVSCQHIERTEYPSTCSGENPVTGSFIREGESNFTIRVCAPGKLGTFPWTLSRSRQDLDEEIYLDVMNRRLSGENPDYMDNDFTIHCTASTIRGYFELGNYRNKYSYGPLIEKWPVPEEIQRDYNDFVSLSVSETSRPSEQDPGKDTDWHGYESEYSPSTSWNMSGPLMVSAAALFGPTSFFNAATNYSAKFIGDEPSGAERVHWQGVCLQMPFNRLMGNSRLGSEINQFPTCELERIPEGWMDERSLLYLLNNWIHGFNDTDMAEKALETSMFLANRAILTVPGSALSQGRSLARNIYSAPGVTIQKPVVSLTAKITISALIIIQFVGLALLTYFIYHIPTWTNMLNAMAVARIAASLDEDSLPLIGAADNGNRKHLDNISGVIGVVENRSVQTRWKSASSSEIELSESIPNQQRSGTQRSLGAGAPGVITRSVVSKISKL